MTRARKVFTPVMTILLLAFLAPIAMAHSLHIESTIEPPRVIVHATYGDGSPSADAFLSIYAPGEAVNVFVSGNSDSQGRFSFEPDRPGRWSAIADDGFGHRGMIDIVLPGNWQRDGNSSTGGHHPAPNRFARLGIGLGVLALISLILFAALRRSAPRDLPR